MIEINYFQLLVGLAMGVCISFLAYVYHALTLGGALAAAVLGTLIFGLGGIGWAALLLVFFVSSSLLSRLAKQRKAGLDEKFSKGSRRDAAQVLANGGLAGLFVLLHAFFPNDTWPWLGAAAALAAANADTWATELGVLSPGQPRLITTGRPAEGGASGAVSLVGLLAALEGSLLVAVVAVLFWPGVPLLPLLTRAVITPNMVSIAAAFTIVITLAGVAGSLVDSLLGATLQAIYYCPTCQKETERFPRHSCGTPTTLIHGLPWLDNDWVNLACTASGAAVALIIYFVI